MRLCIRRPWALLSIQGITYSLEGFLLSSFSASMEQCRPSMTAEYDKLLNSRNRSKTFSKAYS